MEDTKDENAKTENAKISNKKPAPAPSKAETTAPIMEVNVAEDAPKEELGTIKRMINTLDKFLARRMASIGLFYICAMIVCGGALITSGVVTNASNGSYTGGVSSLEIGLYSAAGVLTFLFVLAIVRLVSVRVAKARMNGNKKK